MLRISFTALAVLLSLAFTPAQASFGDRDSRLDFAVYRDDSEIGTHSYVFHRKNDALDVTIKTNIAVKVPLVGITLYHFEHEEHETWKNGSLAALQSKTDEDGTAHHLTVKRDGSKLDVDGDGRTGTSDPSIIPASLWNHGLVDSSVLLNTLDGREMKIDVAKKGTDEVMVGGSPVQARHFVISGGLKREVWYDGDERLVKVQFVGKDGSTITYRLQ